MSFVLIQGVGREATNEGACSNGNDAGDAERENAAIASGERTATGFA